MRKIVKNTSSGQRAQQLINPTKDKKGSYRVYRGGNLRDYPEYLHTSYRGNLRPTNQFSILCFRIVRNK